MRGGGVLGGRGGANFWYNDDDDVDQFFRLGGRLTQVDGWEGLQKNGCSKSGPKMPIAISGNPSFFSVAGLERVIGLAQQARLVVTGAGVRLS
jgi:hypothetical protein